MVDFNQLQQRSLLYGVLVTSFFIGGLASMSLDANWIGESAESTQDVITIGDYDGTDLEDPQALDSQGIVSEHVTASS